MWSTTDGAGNPSPTGTFWYPAECDTTLQNGDNWFYTAPAGVRSPDEMRKVYHDTVGNNCQLLLNLAPDAHGAVSSDQMTAYRELGSYIASCFPSDDSKYPHALPGLRKGETFRLDLGAAVSINRVIIREAIAYGECIAGYAVTSDDGTQVMNGTWVGHKHIHALDASVSVKSVTLSIHTTTVSGCVPAIDFFAVQSC